jgi:hypothetical protein
VAIGSRLNRRPRAWRVVPGEGSAELLRSPRRGRGRRDVHVEDAPPSSCFVSHSAPPHAGRLMPVNSPCPEGSAAGPWYVNPLGAAGCPLTSSGFGPLFTAEVGGLHHRSKRQTC